MTGCCCGPMSSGRSATAISRDPELWALCEGACVPGGLQERLDAAHRSLSRSRSRARATNIRTGSWSIPEKWVPDGYAIVRVDLRGAGCSPGYLEVWSPREAKDLYALHRMGRHAALVERQGRHQRHLLLRHEPVACRALAAAASRGVVHLGRRGRLLPRACAPWRHPLRFPAQLVAPASRECAIRGRRARPAQPGHRRAGCGRADAKRGRARPQPRRCRRGRSAPSPA